ncbi:MAG: prephenate dehydrogenase [Lachnospiraceae bacterium]|nr:prephenate dehydrogenase [Lachnospiraceae bacterium]
MKVGVVGMGLIGGSLVKAYNEHKDWEVYGYDIDTKIVKLAILAEDMADELNEKTIGDCDLIFVALYPKESIAYLEKMASYINKSSIVIDCCGTKAEVCKAGFELSEKYGFIFVGGHPMAGLHYSGYKYSSKDMFKNATMVLVPKTYDDITFLARVKEMLVPAGFNNVTVTTADKHDKMIAFTSQMAHIVSNAFIKSPTAREHKGFSAGSYKDLTRVAWLNENMWTELFLENKDHLLYELEFFIDELTKYRDAIKDNDAEELKKLLFEGKMCKEEVDG